MLIHYIHYSFPSGVILYILLSYHSLPNFLDCVSMSFLDSNPHKHTLILSSRYQPHHRVVSKKSIQPADSTSGPTFGRLEVFLTNKKQKKTAPRGRKVESFPCFLDQWKVWSPLSWKMLRDLTGTGVCISMYQSVSVYVNIYICIFTVLSKSVRMYVYIHENSIVCMIHDFTLLSNNVLAAWRMKRCESKLDNLSSWSWFITRGSVDNLEWWFWLDMNGEICRSSSWYHISCPLPPRQVPHCLPQILPSLPHDARIVRERAASIKRDSRQLYLSTQWSSPTWNLDSSSFVKWVNMFYRFKLGPTLERVPFQSKKKIYIYIPADRDVRQAWNTPLVWFRSSLPLPRFGVWAFFPDKVLRNGLLRYILYTCPNLWCNSCSKCYGMDCFGTYFTHVQTCDVTRVQSATEWTASVHTLHMSKSVM